VRDASLRSAWQCSDCFLLMLILVRSPMVWC